VDLYPLLELGLSNVLKFNFLLAHWPPSTTPIEDAEEARVEVEEWMELEWGEMMVLCWEDERGMGGVLQLDVEECGDILMVTLLEDDEFLGEMSKV